MKTKLFFILLIASILSFSCKNKKNTASDLMKDAAIAKSDSGISNQEILTIITTIPNPVEMSTLLYKSKVKFSSSMLNPADNINKYNVNFKKALNMGVYGSDLVHMNIYDRATSALLYLNAIQTIAKDLGVEKFFDSETLNRLSKNSKNVDSVLFITSTGFDKMNRFLQQNDRTSISVLIGVGTWIESLYLATNYEQVGNKDMVYQRIGDQKFVLDNIMLMLDKYKGDKNFNELSVQMNGLKSVLDKIEIKYEHKEPTTQIVNGMPVTTDNSTSKAMVTDEIFKEIASVSKSIRAKIIQ